MSLKTDFSSPCFNTLTHFSSHSSSLRQSLPPHPHPLIQPNSFMSRHQISQQCKVIQLDVPIRPSADLCIFPMADLCILWGWPVSSLGQVTLADRGDQTGVGRELGLTMKHCGESGVGRGGGSVSMRDKIIQLHPEPLIIIIIIIICDSILHNKSVRFTTNSTQSVRS